MNSLETEFREELVHIEAESIGWIPLDEGRNLFSFQ